MNAMTPSPPGRLVVISGPSGAGKTSVCRALREDPRVEFSVSATTRAMRVGEVEGVDYRFLTQAEFAAADARGEFLESAVYNGNRYGTLRGPMDRALRAGKVFVLEIEVQGTRMLRQKGVDGTYVFVVPPSMEILRERLVKRGQNAAEEIEARLAIAQRELEAKELYDVVIENLDLPMTIARVREACGL